MYVLLCMCSYVCVLVVYVLVVYRFVVDSVTPFTPASRHGAAITEGQYVFNAPAPSTSSRFFRASPLAIVASLDLQFVLMWPTM